MKLFSKAAALFLAASVTVPFINIPPSSVYAASTVTVSPNNTYEINNGIFEGWGSSLCWWANRVGYSDSLSQKAADAFYGDDGLRMNIARFNIGGGDDPSHHHIKRTDSNMPGYTKYNNGVVTYDWTADANQRNVLDRCIKAAGDDMIVEMFSNSPPYYMTNSGCSTGNFNAGKNNLRDDQYTAFAEYLAEVCKHFEEEWNVDVQSIDPMNEPYTNFWGANSPKQEGCHFDIGKSESTIIVELKKALDKRGLSDIIISGTDETSIDTQIDAYNALSADAKSAIGRIDTHTYGGSKRTQLKETAIKAGKNLWMSEVDGKGTAGQNAGGMGAGLWLAQRITDDCNNMNVSAWILWQLIDNHVSSVGYNGNKDSGMPNINDGFWGVAVADHDKDEIILSKKYYAFGQYTRYIRPGMTMLKSSGTTMAAFDKKNGQLVLVAYNTSGGNSEMVFDLSQFDELGASAQTIRTSPSEDWKDVGATPVGNGVMKATLAGNSVTTFIIDGVKGGADLTNKISITSDMISGSKCWNNSANTYAKAFDGDTSSYFDGLESGWAMVDLGSEYDISAIGFAPRSGYEHRCPDGSFMISDDGENWSTMYTIQGKPASGMNYISKLSGTTTGRYVKYQIPSGAPKNEYNKDNVYNCNIAEIELYGAPKSLAELKKIDISSVTGSDPWRNSDNDCTKAFDGNTGTFFDGLEGGWVQADLGAVYDLSSIGFCPRRGYEYRCPDGKFLISKDGVNWTEVYTITNKPVFGMQYITDLGSETSARYVKYQIPEGTPKNSYNKDDVYNCNIAEIAVFGEPSGTQQPDKVKGDLDADGELLTNDLVMLAKFLHGTGTVTNGNEADLNGDGSVDVFDLIAMRKLLVR